MAESSKIEWTDHTFNPWIGCAKVSAGCTNCYAETLMDTRYGRVRWGVHGTRVRTSEANWKKPVLWNARASRAGQRARVFCASLADVFEDRDELLPWRADLFRLMESTDWLQWLVLTKRPEAVLRMVPAQWRSGFPHHVAIGTSVENQEALEVRLPDLVRIPAHLRFLSMEPLLGAVDLQLRFRAPEDWGRGPVPRYDLLHWIIVGGESGPGARPCHVEHVRSIVHQAHRADVPVFVKQLGGRPVVSRREYAALLSVGIECVHGYDVCPECDAKDVPMLLVSSKGGDPSEWPEDIRVREWPR